VITFTILGLIVFYIWCFQAGYWLAFALDVLVPMWLSIKASESHLLAVIAAMCPPDPGATA
jgi:hypothetical protein